jgi:GNAT superfamily N-acetyltransferase
MTVPEQPHITVETLEEYSAEVAAGMGALLPHLSDRFDGQPVPQDLLQEVIDSSDREQFLAFAAGKIAGMSTLNTITSPSGRTAWLADFVVDPEKRRQGVSHALANAMEEWCEQRGILVMQFTSGWERKAAHTFYKDRGAQTMNTAVFLYPIGRSVEQ